MCPAYDFKCNDCEHSEEYIFRISEKPEFLKCPKCEKEMYNQLSAPSHKFKGYGWSNDGYSSGPSQDQLNNRSKYRDEYAKIKPAKTGEVAPNVQKFLKDD